MNRELLFIKFQKAFNINVKGLFNYGAAGFGGAGGIPRLGAQLVTVNRVHTAASNTIAVNLFFIVWCFSGNNRRWRGIVL